MTPRAPPELISRRDELSTALQEAVTLDALTPDWFIFQRRRGHRHSTDDLLTAWYATEHVSRARALLDLGAGIGTVGILVLSQHPGALLTTVEVQDLSFRLQLENIRANHLENRITAIHDDLRNLRCRFELAGRHDLVTASPPYFDIRNGIVPADPQKAAARFELHGDVADYCRAARGTLAKDGRFVFCFPTVQRGRALDAVRTNGLAAERMRDVVPRESRPPLFTLFCCARVEDRPLDAIEEAPLIVRDNRGIHTEEMLRARRRFGMGPGGDVESSG